MASAAQKLRWLRPPPKAASFEAPVMAVVPLLATARRAAATSQVRGRNGSHSPGKVWKSIREEVGTSRSAPLARTRAARDPEIDVAAPSSAPVPYPLPAAAQPGQPQRTRFAAGTAIFTRER